MTIPMTTEATNPRHEVMKIMGRVIGTGNSALGLKSPARKAGTSLNRQEEGLIDHKPSLCLALQSKLDNFFYTQTGSVRGR